MEGKVFGLYGILQRKCQNGFEIFLPCRAKRLNLHHIIHVFYTHLDMIVFFKVPSGNVIAAGVKDSLTKENEDKLCWLFGNAERIEGGQLDGFFCGSSSRNDHSVEHQRGGNNPEHEYS